MIGYSRSAAGVVCLGGTLCLFANPFAAVAGGAGGIVSQSCPDAIYSAVLNKERYRQECYRLSLPAQRTLPPEAPPAVYPPTPLEEGGLFEVRLRNLFWPDKLSVCPTLTVRMPWSDPDEQRSAIDQKRRFRDGLEAFATGGSAIPEVFVIAVMVTRDSLIHSGWDAPHAIDAEVDPDGCLVFFQTDGQTGSYLPPEPSADP
jgi:hypothetical protein